MDAAQSSVKREIPDAFQLVNLGRTVAAPVPIGGGALYYVPGTEHRQGQVLDTEKHGLMPSRKYGIVATYSVESFLSYYKDHATNHSRVFVDVDINDPKIVGVLNPHPRGNNPHPNAQGMEAAAWWDHRVQLVFRPTPEWGTWTEKDNKWMGQEEFGDFIETNLKDIADPPAADMLEIVLTLQAKTNVQFRQATRLENGQVQLEYVNAIEATAGERGQFQVPREFKLALAPFEGSPAYAFKARFRYRTEGGALRLSYVLDRRVDLIREVLKDTIAKIEEAGAVVLHGVPPTLR